jgi:hypothetical protein
MQPLLHSPELSMRCLPLFALLALATPAVAQDAAPQQPTAPVEKKICRAGQSTGTIIPAKRICHTKSEWAAIDGVNGRENDRLRDRMNNGSDRPR